MARQINGKGDIREALYDIKTKVAFLAYVHNRIHDQGDLVADIAHEGMLSVFGDIEDQINEIDKTIQDDVYEVTVVNIKKNVQ